MPVQLGDAKASSNSRITALEGELQQRHQALEAAERSLIASEVRIQSWLSSVQIWFCEPKK
jgi:hypothetical protein